MTKRDRPAPVACTTTTVSLPVELRVAIDALRVGRAQREGRLPPRLREVVVEALTEYVARESAR